MNTKTLKKIGYVLIVVAAFYTGKFSEKLNHSLKSEKEFPADLKSASEKFPDECKTLKKIKQTGQLFSLDILDKEKIIRLLTYEPKTNTIRQSILDMKHRQYYDDWETHCN
jgi:hypothetical protein